MRVIITGGSGLIGRALAENLTKDGHEVFILSRTPEKVANLPQGAIAVSWDAKTADGWGELIEETQVVVNLAGENLKGKGLFPKRWTAKRKALIRQSRLDAGKAVLQAIRQAKRKPELIIQASAVGYYGPRGNEQISEDNAPGSDFLANVCREWEESTAGVQKLNTRRVILRTGLPLTLTGGAFPSLVLPFRLFAGNTFGSGKQFYPWIHFEDYIRAARFLIDDAKSSGPYNLSAPNPVTNREFATALGKVMHRPSFLPVPRFALEIPFGEVATVVMDGQRTVPTKMLQSGFEFHFPSLEPALKDLFRK